MNPWHSCFYFSSMVIGGFLTCSAPPVIIAQDLFVGMSDLFIGEVLVSRVFSWLCLLWFILTCSNRGGHHSWPVWGVQEVSSGRGTGLGFRLLSFYRSQSRQQKVHLFLRGECSTCSCLKITCVGQSCNKSQSGNCVCHSWYKATNDCFSKLEV